MSSAAVLGALNSSVGSAEAAAAASCEGDRVGFDVPSDACDTHVHILKLAEFPFSAKRRSTRDAAIVNRLLALQNALGLDRMVAIQNSI